MLMFIALAWRSSVMRHQELHAKHSADLANAFSNMIYCSACNSAQPMKIRALYAELYCGRDIIFCQCEECGAETAEFAGTL
jgi:predicted amidohydrolase